MIAPTRMGMTPEMLRSLGSTIRNLDMSSVMDRMRRAPSAGGRQGGPDAPGGRQGSPEGLAAYRRMMEQQRAAAPAQMGGMMDILRGIGQPAPRQGGLLPDFVNNLPSQPSREELRQQPGLFNSRDVNVHGSKAVTIYGPFGPSVVYESSPGRYTDQMGMPLVGITPDMFTPPPGGYPTKGQPPAMGQMGQPDAMQPPMQPPMMPPQMRNNFSAPMPFMALSSGNLATPAVMQRLGVADMMRNAGMMNQPAQQAQAVAMPAQMGGPQQAFAGFQGQQNMGQQGFPPLGQLAGFAKGGRVSMADMMKGYF